MDEVSLIRSSYSLIQKDFGLEEELTFEEAQSATDRLKSLLVVRLNHLLDHDFSSLLNSLYRIDISEEKVRRTLQTSKQDDLAANLADLIIGRQKQKVITRLTYQQG